MGRVLRFYFCSCSPPNRMLFWISATCNAPQTKTQKTVAHIEGTLAQHRLKAPAIVGLLADARNSCEHSLQPGMLSLHLKTFPAPRDLAPQLAFICSVQPLVQQKSFFPWVAIANHAAYAILRRDQVCSFWECCTHATTTPRLMWVRHTTLFRVGALLLPACFVARLLSRLDVCQTPHRQIWLYFSWHRIFKPRPRGCNRRPGF